MTARLGRFVLVLLCTIPSTIHAQKTKQVDNDKIAQWIEQLGNRRYSQRQAAMRALAEQPGEVVLKLLELATRHRDAEIRQRAAVLYQKVRNRFDTQRRLRPQTILLSYDKRPLDDVIRDFNKRTGMSIELERTSSRPVLVTLKTDAISHWEALDRICQQAGYALKRPNVTDTSKPSARIVESRNRVIIYLDERYGVSRPTADHKLTITPSVASATAAVNAGALRVQAWPDSGEPGRSLLLGFEVEKRLQWNHLVSLHVESAVDDQGQQRAAPKVYVDLDQAIPRDAQEVIVIWDGYTKWPTASSGQQRQIELLIGKTPAKTLKELRGTLRANVSVPEETLLTIDDLRKAKGKTLQSVNGRAITVEQARRVSGDRFELELTHHGSDVLRGLGVPLAGKNVRLINRQGRRGLIVGEPTKEVIQLTGSALQSKGLTVLDANGKALTLVKGTLTTQSTPGMRQAEGDKQSYKLVFAIGTSQPGPRKLVYRGRLDTMLTVPFTLQDVPLQR